MNRKTFLTLGVALAAGALAAVALYARRAPDEASTDPAARPTLPLLNKKKPRRGGEPKAQDPAGPLDLLELVDAEKDTVAGAWGFELGFLTTSSVPWGRLQLPVIPPEEYELTMRVSRRGGNNSLNLGLPVGARQVVLILDGWDKGDKSGLDRVGDKSFFENETTRTGRFLPQGAVVTIVCEVRKDAIKASVDGGVVVDWKGDPKKLALWPDWKIPERGALFIGSWESVFAIDDLKLKPLSGSSRLLR
jgi:hypothetical protein